MNHRVDDILEGRSEQDKVLFSSEDFVLLPDMKWDLHTVQSLYLVAISRDPTLRSLRDLQSKHVPLLKEIRDVACNVTNQKFGIPKGGLRMWIHYQPSYCEHIIFLSLKKH
jgi:m7GpppX diphosphatase